MSTTATQTYQQGVQNLQAWLDFLAAEEEKLESQLAKMQGGGAHLPEIEADVPSLAEEQDLPEVPEKDAGDKPEKWT